MLKRFMERVANARVVGVDLGSEVLKAVELSRAEGGVVLRACVVEPINGQGPAALLKRSLADGASQVHVALGLASPELVVRPFEVPPMSRRELAKALRLEAEQAILDGHRFEEMAVDWHLTGGGAKSSLRGVLAVAPRTLVESRLSVARQAGLRPVVVDAEGLALWNAWLLAAERAAARQTVMLLNVGARCTNLVIAATPDELIVVRDIQLGGQALGADQGRDWVGEVRDSLAYARSRSGRRAVESAAISGGGASQKLAALVTEATGVPAKLWNPLKSVLRAPSSPQIPESSGPLLAVAIGLALRQLD